MDIIFVVPLSPEARTLDEKTKTSSAANVDVAASIDTLAQRFDTFQITLDTNQKAIIDALTLLTNAFTGQQATSTSVGATASSTQVPVMQSSASAPTQPPSTSLPSDTTSDTTASGDSKLGLDPASAALNLDSNPDVKVKTLTTAEKVTATEASTLPSANQTSTASNVIVVEPRVTAASTVAPAGATQTQSPGFQPSAPQSVWYLCQDFDQ